MLQIWKLGQIIVICSFWGDWYSDWYLFARFIHLVTAQSFTFRPNQIPKYFQQSLTSKRALNSNNPLQLFPCYRKNQFVYRKFSTFFHFGNIRCRLFLDGESADITEINGFSSFFENEWKNWRAYLFGFALSNNFFKYIEADFYVKSKKRFNSIIINFILISILQTINQFTRQPFSKILLYQNQLKAIDFHFISFLLKIPILAKKCPFWLHHNYMDKKILSNCSCKRTCGKSK